MLFNSIEFLVFLPIVFLLYWFVFKPLKLQNLFVVVASYLFYGWWDARFLVLIAFTSICSYYSGIFIKKVRKRAVAEEDSQKIERRARWIVAANITINLLILGIFKYYNFFLENFEALFAQFGIKLSWPTLKIILPVGISFYTFQALSYTIDVYRKKLEPTKDVIAFFAFISFFPQLVAGPIERATNLLPQFLKSRTFDYVTAVDGCRQMLWGFVKKIVVADQIAPIVENIWNNYQTYNGLSLFIGGVLFTFQIYCDFSGYSNIAIGTAKLFGFNLMRNFDNPYFSRSIPEFWRRWHISLTTWFRDYIYFPLGGSRCGKWKIIRNVLIVWAISGLWHGANWTFVVWGLYHGLLLAIYNLFSINTKYEHIVAYGRKLPNIKELLQMSLTFVLAVIGWIIFRAESIGQAYHYLRNMVTKAMVNITDLNGEKFVVLGFAMLVFEWIFRERNHEFQMKESGALAYRGVRWALYLIFIFLCIRFSGTKSDFIYFQF